MPDRETETAAFPAPTLGRYQLLRKLGQGGMGEVYLAQDTKLDRRVAVKVLPPHAVNDPDAVARFQREAKALAQLSHPGIVQAFDSDSAGERHFLVMEFVDGTSLSDVLKQHGKLSPGQAADYIHQTALALQHAHDKGLVHRDLKPSNLLLTSDGRVKLLDLGLARFLQDQIADPGLTREHTGMGTPDYAAPEQFRDAHKADARSDIYALGCTLYHLLTGQVPFPGSSMQEKHKAHEHKTPPPIQALSPEAPVGLIAAAEKMMAKQPADRYQTAKEVAEALAPNVRGSSVCFDALMTTRTWQAAQSTMPIMPRRRSLLPWVGGAVAGMTVALLALLVFWPPPESARDPGSIAQLPAKDSSKDSAARDKGTAAPDPKQDPQDPPRKQEPARQEPPRWEEPDVLTVAQDGSARFKTIKDAVAEVKPGQTIRVLDDKDYAEPLILQNSAVLENVTLEAVRRACLVGTADGIPVVRIVGVSGLTIRGFRLRATASKVILVLVEGRCPDLRLEYLEFAPGHASTSGVEIYRNDLPYDAPPLLVHHCQFHRLAVGIVVLGKVAGAQAAATAPTRRVAIRQNLISGSRAGVVVYGQVGQVQVVGNRVQDMDMSGVNLQQVGADTRDVLVANNTLLRCRHSLRLWDAAAYEGANVRVCNNLILECPDEDFTFSDCSQNPDLPLAGDGVIVAKRWHVHHNWRELSRLDDPGGKDFPGRVPLGPTEKQAKHFDGVNRDAKSPSYLRPDPGSPLATDGAGQTDPSLPSYVGALPPLGQPAWDWSRTWLAPLPGVLLTVSKDEKAGGKYRALNDALKDAKPWATIRVLDAETYEETVKLDDAEKQLGLCLEAPLGATVLLGGPRGAQPWLIKDVPHVRLRGFKFRSDPALSRAGFLRVAGRASGIVLEDLDCQATGKMDAFGLTFIHCPPGEPPLIVRRCQIDVPYDAITASAPPAAKGNRANGGLVLDGNRIRAGMRGIRFVGALARVRLTSNVFWQCGQAGIQITDPRPGLDDFLVAGNTLVDCGSGLRVWVSEGAATPGRVTLLHNVAARCNWGDLACFQDSKDGGGDACPAALAAVATDWRFAGNWRDTLGAADKAVIPLAARDHLLGDRGFVSVDPKSADFLRPSKEFAEAMATDQVPGAPPLPAYAGAMPPPGVEAWDWERTWHREDRP